MTKGRFTVSDRDGRQLTFDGVLLGRASSKASGKSRWTEISIYRTQAGAYIIEQSACTSVEGEQRWVYVHVSETAEGVIEVLHQYDSREVRYLTRTAKRAITAAMKHDEALRAAYLVERVA